MARGPSGSANRSTGAPVWVDARGLTPSGAPLPTRKDALETRRRLIEAAGPIFAKRGYDGAVVRDIVAAAGVNLGAVNRHFGSKQGLYREVLVTYHMALMQEEPPPELGDFEDSEQAIYHFMRFLLRLVLIRRGPDSVAGQLMMQEVHNPSEVLDDLVQLFIAPNHSAISEAIGDLLGQADTPRLREQATNYVFGLCLFHSFGREVLKRLGTPSPTNDAQIDELIGTLHPFAIGGIRAMARRPAEA